MTNPEIVRKLNRSLSSVQSRRHTLGIPAPNAHRTWTAAEDRLLATMTNRQTATKLHLPIEAVQHRRRWLKHHPRL